ISGKGFMPVEGVGMAQSCGTSIHRHPLYRREEQIKRNYCAFWKKDNSGYYIEEFADILKAQYKQ
ncbi:MAG: LysR family transcriptional regulator, partial [Lachnospiraceae bacterium]|nr:LysR family transcriptional regulator [Lachnospiraceae bacterium]